MRDTKLETNKIYQGDAKAVLSTFPDECIDMAICSPPYWGLRDYGVEGQLGLESTFQEYIQKLCNIFDEVKRVLKKEGTCYVNMGDTYGGSGGDSGKKEGTQRKGGKGIDTRPVGISGLGLPPNAKVMPKCLIGIPELFVIEMAHKREWIRRNTIIWFKSNCMPSSADDRFTVDFEYLYFFSKSNDPLFWTNEKTLQLVTKKPLGTNGAEGIDWEWRQIDDTWQRPSRDETFKTPDRQKSTYAKSKNKKVSLWTAHDYYFERQFERYDKPLDRWGGEKLRPHGESNWDEGTGQNTYRERSMRSNNQGRNKRCVWQIPTQPYPEAHFATYPEALLITPINASCPEFVCMKCGKGREKIYERVGGSPSTLEGRKKIDKMNAGVNVRKGGEYTVEQYNIAGNAEYKSKGYTDCGCNVEYKPGIVLDPFMGAGTTALIARKLNRNYIGIELSPEYIKKAEKRLSQQYFSFK